MMVVMFLALISFPLINAWLGWLADLPSGENRQLAPAPTLDISHLDPFPQRYEAYYNDHFPMRFRLVDCYTRLHLYGFHASPIPDQAIIGEDGWYFLGGNEQDSYLGRNALDALELDSLRLELEYRQQYLAELGTAFYLMIAPAKNNVYTDKMPYWAVQSAEKSWGERVNAYLAAHSNIRIIDLYAPFKARRDQTMLYYKLDHHWTEQGAFVAANVAISAMQADIPALVPNAISDYKVTRGTATSGSITSMFGIQEDFEDSTFSIVPRDSFRAIVSPKVPYEGVEGFPYPWDFENVRTVPGIDKPRLLLISDSYGHHVFPFMAEAFGRSVKIFDSWQYKLNEPIATHEKADAVVLLIVESNLRNLLQHASLKRVGWPQH
jgi:hypothetical protein